MIEDQFFTTPEILWLGFAIAWSFFAGVKVTLYLEDRWNKK